MEIKLGTSVKVKPGILDPDFEKFDMTNWQGRVVEIDGNYIAIEWDSITLEEMPWEYIEIGFEDDYEPFSIWLNINDVEITKPRDSLYDTQQKIDEIYETYETEIEDREKEKRIAKILGTKDLEITPDNLIKYHDYLEEHLVRPCILTGIERFSWEDRLFFGVISQEEYNQLKKTYPSYSDTYELIKLSDLIDDLRGIFVEVKRLSDKKEFELPLVDLKTANPKDINSQLISDYIFWFAYC